MSSARADARDPPRPLRRAREPRGRRAPAERRTARRRSLPWRPSPAVRRARRSTSRALRSRVRKFEKRGRWRAAKTMISQFASHEVAEFPVELEIARTGGESRRHQGLTDKEGFVHFDIRLDPDWDYDAHPAWETVVFHWQLGDENQCLDAHVLAPGTEHIQH